MKNYTYPVRWIGTYFGGGNVKHQRILDSVGSIRESLEWELSSIREKSYALTNGSAVGSAWIGLLVDLPKSKIDIIKRSDGYSLRYSHGLKMIFESFHETSRDYHERDDSGEQIVTGYKKQSIANDRTYPVKPHLTKKEIRDGWHTSGYFEALGYLSFVGIVVSTNASVKQVSMAQKVSKEINLPYLGKLRSFRPGKYMSY